MRGLRAVRGLGISLPDADVDTDIIYPARFLLVTAKKGLGIHAFADRRGVAGFPIQAGNDRPILIAGPNFGCGSSREQAAWAIGDLGIRVIVAESFGEIFASNCFRNGMLPVVLPAESVSALHGRAQADETISVDVAARTIEAGGDAFAFDLDEDRREALLNGWNDTTRTIALHGADIARFETAQRRAAPWLWTTRT